MIKYKIFFPGSDQNFTISTTPSMYNMKPFKIYGLFVTPKSVKDRFFIISFLPITVAEILASRENFWCEKYGKFCALNLKAKINS